MGCDPLITLIHHQHHTTPNPREPHASTLHLRHRKRLLCAQAGTVCVPRVCACAECAGLTGSDQRTCFLPAWQCLTSCVPWLRPRVYHPHSQPTGLVCRFLTRFWLEFRMQVASWLVMLRSTLDRMRHVRVEGFVRGHPYDPAVPSPMCVRMQTHLHDHPNTPRHCGKRHPRCLDLRHSDATCVALCVLVDVCRHTMVTPLPRDCGPCMCACLVGLDPHRACPGESFRRIASGLLTQV